MFGSSAALIDALVMTSGSTCFQDRVLSMVICGVLIIDI